MSWTEQINKHQVDSRRFNIANECKQNCSTYISEDVEEFGETIECKRRRTWWESEEQVWELFVRERGGGVKSGAINYRICEICPHVALDNMKFPIQINIYELNFVHHKTTYEML